jgi:hypothetical protein
MQPYFDPTRKTTLKKWKTTSKKNGRQPQKIKMEDKLIFSKNYNKMEGDRKKIKNGRRPKKNENGIHYQFLLTT